MKPVWALLAVSLMPAGTASADEMVLTFRSGRVQTLHLDEPSSDIQGIAYRQDKPTTGSPSSSHEAGTRERASVASTPEQEAGAAPTISKPKVRMEWAQPLE